VVSREWSRLRLHAGNRYAPLAAVADFLSAVLFYHERMLSWTVALGPAGTLACATAAVILRRRLRIDLDLSHRRDVVRYTLVTLIAAVFSTAAGIGGLLADHSNTWGQFWLSAFNWYSGDAIALVGVGPFLLIHVFPWIRRQLFDFAPEERLTQTWKTFGETIGEAIEMVAQVIAVLLVLWVMFGSPLASHGFYYLSFLPIIWIAMRQGIGRVSGGVLLFNFGVVLSLRVFNADSIATVNLGTLMLAVSFTGLIVGSAVSERYSIGHELHEQTLYLHSLIENSPFGIVVLVLCAGFSYAMPRSKVFFYSLRERCPVRLLSRRTLGTGVCRAACS
jgi:two-component system, LuxR family, sensor kinase FixL